MLRKRLPRFLLGVACVLLFLGHAGRLWQIPFVTVLDAYLYDVRVRAFMPNTLDERIVIVDIDEKSLAEMGRWPWGRQHVAKLLRRLTDDYQASIVGFDVVFAEPDASSGLPVLEQMAQGELRDDPRFRKTLDALRPSLDYDQDFVNTLQGRPVILGYYFSGQDAAERHGALPPPVFAATEVAGLPGQFFAWQGFGANLPQFQNAALGAGHFNPIVDDDGVSRRVPLLVEHDGHIYEALSLAMLRALLGQPQIQLGIPDPENGIEWLSLKTPSRQFQIPVDQKVAALIPFRGYEHSFPYVSAVDVLKGRVPAEQLRGKIILVGTTAPGLNDLRSTPVGGAYPGVEIHANLLAGFLDGSVKEKPAFVMGIEVVHVLLLGCLLAFWLPALSPLRASLVALMAMLASVGFNFWMWDSADYVLPLASGGILVTLLLYAINMSWGYFIETRSKRQFADLFGQYVPPELVEEMSKDPEQYSMAGRSATLSVLFSDVRNFTSISEGLEAQELTQLMNVYLGVMTEVIRQQRGTLDKYIGDAIMAFWGAPVADEQHAVHAVRTALRMQSELARAAPQFLARGWPALQIGIGINTGVMTVGDMGSPVRKAYTVMGDAVNLASRLEGITKIYGVGIVVGEATRQQAIGIVYRELDWVRVKGKDKPVAIFEPIALEQDISALQRAEMAQWETVLQAYRQQDWDTAEDVLQRLKQTAPEARLYELYLERIAHLRTAPPGLAWDGVTTFTSK
jgi:adenylate cyclase